MTKILSMFFTGLTLLSYGQFSHASCLEDLTTGYRKDVQGHRDTQFGEVLLEGKPKQTTDGKVSATRLPADFIKLFCSSDLQARTDDLKLCFEDAFDAGIGSEVQPSSQTACVGVLSRHAEYSTFKSCFDKTKKMMRDQLDAFDACI